MSNQNEILEGQSECLHQHGEQQGQVLGTSDWEFVCGVEVDDFWDGVKRSAVLSQHVLAIFALGELHVHETLAAPVRNKTYKHEEWLEKGKKTKEGSGRNSI